MGCPTWQRRAHCLNRLRGRLREKSIGQGLRELYEVSKDLPPKLLALVRRLDAVEDSTQFVSETLVHRKIRRNRRQVLVPLCATS